MLVSYQSKSPTRAGATAVAPYVGQGYYYPNVSFAVQPTLSRASIDPYRVQRNYAVAGGPDQPGNIYQCYRGSMTLNYITHVYPPGTVQAPHPQTTADQSGIGQHSEDPGKGSDYDKLAATNADLVRRLAKTEEELKKLHARLADDKSNKPPAPASPAHPADAWGGTGSKAGSRAVSPARSNQGGGWANNSNVGSSPASNQDQGWGSGGAKGGAEGNDGWGGDAAAPDAGGGGGGW